VNQSPHAEDAANALQQADDSGVEMSRGETSAVALDSTDGVEGPGRITIEMGEEGEELHPHVRRGAAPEFEGERNPKTGEIGGPKVEPLRWGGNGDWSYNGRVSDF
jgi:hypothetical protein